jgi:hypothetical protein
MSFLGIGGAVRKKKLSYAKVDFLDAVTEYRKHYPRVSEREAEENVIKIQMVNPTQFERLVKNARQRY